MGILLSAFSWTYAWTQIPVGWLAERYGAHLILAAGLALWASATILIGFAHTLRDAAGAAAAARLGRECRLSRSSEDTGGDRTRQGSGHGERDHCTRVFVGPGGGHARRRPVDGDFGWRSAFWVFGGLSLLWLLPWVGVAGQVRTAVRDSKEESPTWWMILKQPSLWGTSLGLFSSNYVFYFMLAWLPSYLQTERGFSIIDMAWVATSAYMVNALSAFLAGWGVDKYLARGGSANVGYKSVMAVAHVGSVICMLAMALGSPAVALVSLFVYQSLCGASSPGIYAMSEILAGPPASGRWVGIQNSLGNLPGIIAPWLTGYIIQSTGHYTIAFVVAAGVSLLGLIGWLWMVPTELDWKVAGSGGRGAVL
jgi:MFS family permease